MAVPPSSAGTVLLVAAGDDYSDVMTNLISNLLDYITSLQNGHKFCYGEQLL